MTDQILDVGYDSDLLDFSADNTPYLVSGVTAKYAAGEPTVARETLKVNGKDFVFDVRTTLVDPRISSVSLRETNSITKQGRIDFNATVVSRRVCEVLFNGAWVPAEKVFLALLRALTNNTITKSDEELLAYFSQYGFEPAGELPMYLQHLGASREEYEQVIAKQILEFGAATRPVRSSQNKITVLSSLRANGSGVPIASLEIGFADRTRATVNPNSGFIGFLEAYWNSFREMVAIDIERSKLRKVIDAGKPAEDDEDGADLREAYDVAFAREDAIRNMFSAPATRRPFRNWGGTSKVVDVLDDSVSYYSQQVPCGRLEVVIGGEVRQWSVWRSNTDSTESTDAPSATVSSEDMVNHFSQAVAL